MYNMYKLIIAFILLIFICGCLLPKQYLMLEGFREGFDSDGSQETQINKECPNLLIEKDGKIYLYNSNAVRIPGVNPIQFNNLEEYTEFLEWQKSSSGQSLRCPVLYLQHSFSANGQRKYNVRPSVTEPQAGLPPTLVRNKYNNINDYDDVAMGENTNLYTKSTDINNDLDEVHSGNIGDNPGTNPNTDNYTKFVDASRDDYPFNTNSYVGYDPTSFYQGTILPTDIADKNDITFQKSNPMSDAWAGRDFTQKLVDSGYYEENEVSILVP